MLDCGYYFIYQQAFGFFQTLDLGAYLFDDGINLEALLEFLLILGLKTCFWLLKSQLL